MAGKALELRDLRSFAAVAEAQNLSRAAARLHTAQPGLSRQMRDLERALGVELLDRHPRGVSPTAAGEVLARGASELLAMLAQAVDRAEAVRDGRRGRVVLGATLAAIASGLPGSARGWRRSRSGARSSIEYRCP